jgi:phenylalanyl-tRNA synthetase beta chain
MMICDSEKPVGIPGVMGGRDSEVTQTTREIILESANFLNTYVRASRKLFGLNTEASYRFERSVDPNLAPAGLHRFTELLAQCSVTANASNPTDFLRPMPQRAPILVKVDRAQELMGFSFSADEAKTALSRLGMSLQADSGPEFQVIPPSWRPDVTRFEDVVEEIGRVLGYEKIPSILPAGSTPMGGVKGPALFADRLKETLIRVGLTQLMSHSLRDLHPLDDSSKRIAPRNPASPEHCVLRNSLLPGLAEGARRNGGKDLHFFEIGKVFWESDGYQEHCFVATLQVGALAPSALKGEKHPSADFYAAKAVWNEVFGALGIRNQVEWRVPDSVDGRFHPTRCASLIVQSVNVGTVGQIHPSVAAKCGMDNLAILGEINFDILSKLSIPGISLRPISRNPAALRDIAIVIDKSTPFAMLEEAIQNAGGHELERHWLFDVYEGPGVEIGKHSLGVGLQFRKPNANFTDDEANRARDAIVQALEQLGAKLRS